MTARRLAMLMPRWGWFVLAGVAALIALPWLLALYRWWWDLALGPGAFTGAFVPLAVYVVSHYDLDLAHPWSPALALVIGGLLYSATTVYQWGLQAFGSWYKALGFAVLVGA